MYSTSKNYWFTIEPYVYSQIKMNEVILLNTLNGYLVRSKNEKINELVKEAQTKKNLSVCFMNGQELDDYEFLEIIKELRENFMIDIIDTTLSNGKPIQFVSKSNLVSDDIPHSQELQTVHRDNVLSYLNEVTIVINSTNKFSGLLGLHHFDKRKSEKIDVLDFSKIKKLCNKVLKTSIGKIRIVGLDISSYPNIINLISFFSKIDISVEFEFYGLNIDYEIISLCVNRSIVVLTRELNESIEVIKQKIPSYKQEKYRFVVETKTQLEELDVFISLNEITNYEVVPFFNGKNYDFFEEYVFMDETDICSISQDLKSIHARRLLNTNDFGKLTILPDEKVYANVNHPFLGTIEDDIRELIYKELTEGQSWLHIRDMEPCCDCIYQWLCPSPSNYEITIGKPNLCHIKAL
jgi:pseudo-rSAM protein